MNGLCRREHADIRLISADQDPRALESSCRLVFDPGAIVVTGLVPEGGGPVDASIRVIDGDAEVVGSLAEWLAAERELRGVVRPVSSPIGETQLGAVTEMITVALGSGGAGSVLASSLITWLRTRPASVKLLVKSGNRSVELDIRTLEDVRPLLEQIPV